jgi:TetR/AcrR family transcriptional repressor of nem operon
MRTSDSAEKIIAVAQQLIQQRGVKAMSYADISAAVGIGKPTIHHHFPTKAKLVETVAESYLTAYRAELDHIEASGGDALGQLDAYGGLFASSLENDQMCLCGMLAADISLLSEAGAGTVRAFADANISFLERLIARGQGQGCFRDAGPVTARAATVFSALEGALLMARGLGNPAHLDRVRSTLPELLS